MRTLVSVAAALIIFSGVASATEVTGQDLAEACKSSQPERTMCLAYIQGFSDGYVRNGDSHAGFLRNNLRSGHLVVAAKDQRVDRLTYCVDDKVPAEVVREVYLKWATEYPDELHQSASSALFNALTEAYPCRAGHTPSAKNTAYSARKNNG